MELKTESDFKALHKKCTDKPIFVLFWADWDQGSSNLKTMMAEMPKVYQSVRFAYVDCDESDLVDFFEVDSVQAIVICHPENSLKKNETHNGIKPESLTQLVQV